MYTSKRGGREVLIILDIFVCGIVFANGIGFAKRGAFFSIGETADGIETVAVKILKDVADIFFAVILHAINFFDFV